MVESTRASVPETASDKPEVIDNGVWTIPNAFSFVRLLCVPLFLWLLFVSDHPAVAAWLLVLLGATDWVDGYIARRFNQGSEFGKILDPTADRALLIAGAVALLVIDSVPIQVRFFVWVVLVREILVGAVTITLALVGARRIDVVWAGKAGTFFVMPALPMFVLAAYIEGFWHWEMLIMGWISGVVGVVLGYYAVLQYIPLARVALREGRAARAGTVG
jgi:cardiolipin synthase (CMP-forming)